MAQPSFDRPVPFWRLYLRFGGWFSIAFFVMMVAPTIGSHFAHGLADRFEAEGRETVAKVLDKYWTESTDSDGDRTITHWFTLAYRTNAGRDMQIDDIVSSSLYDAIDIGGRLPILYLDSDPARIETSFGANRTAGVVMQVIALVFGALTLGALWFSGRRAVAAIRARRYGRTERVAVGELYQTAVSVNGKRRYRLKWREANGREGYSLMYPKDALLPFPPGHRITIYHGLKRAFWEGDVGPRKD
ncbi:hypothetical protein [Tropicibacter sp. S64]|uniref:hypothetical protein n=1 Tax=Tropicibacter sp. S64 TaxID=3415122 RepID=UPI003C79952E